MPKMAEDYISMILAGETFFQKIWKKRMESGVQS